MMNVLFATRDKLSSCLKQQCCLMTATVAASNHVVDDHKVYVDLEENTVGFPTDITPTSQCPNIYGVNTLPDSISLS